MLTIYAKSRWACPHLKALPTSLLCLLCAGSSLSHAQDPEPTILKLQVLAWNNNVRDLAAQSMPEPVMLSATRGRVSSIYTVTTTSPLMLFRKDAAGVSTLVASVPFKEGLREALLLLSERDGKIAGALMPFASKDFPKNTATIFNITDFPVFAQIDGERSEPILSPRPQDQIRSACRKTARTGLTDACTGAGHEDPTSFEFFHRLPDQFSSCSCARKRGPRRGEGTRRR